MFIDSLYRLAESLVAGSRHCCYLAVAVLIVISAACRPLGVVNELSPSDHYERSSGLAYGSLVRQTLDIYTPRSRATLAPLVVFFYGGGWREGSKSDYQFVASSLTEAGYAVVIPDYRLFPDVVFPEFVEDGAAAVSWSLQHARDYGADPGETYLMGHSAGAHIAALLSTDPRYLEKHGIASRALQGFVGLSGPYDFLPIESGYLLEVFPEDTREASQPINFVSPDVPPTLLLHGTDDDVVEPKNSERLAARLVDQGVDVTLALYDGTGHVRVVAALAPPLDFTGKTLEHTLDFLDRHRKAAD